MFFEEINPEIVYDSKMLKYKTNSYFNSYERHTIIVILFVSAFLGLISKAEEYKTEQNISYKVLNNEANNEYKLSVFWSLFSALLLEQQIIAKTFSHNK